MKALIVAAMLAQSPPLVSKSVPKGHVTEAPGCWLDARTCEHVAKKVERLEAENKELRKPVSEPKWLLIGIAFVAGFAGGVVAYDQLRR